MMKIPQVLEEVLFRDLRARYQRNPVEVTNNLVAKEEQILNYLGTYFPRSFAEAYETFIDLLSNPLLYTKFSGKANIKLLDIGAGTGGYALGVIWALKTRFGHLPQVEVVAIEGNNDHINYLQHIFSAVFPNQVRIRPVQTEFNSTNFKTVLQQIL